MLSCLISEHVLFVANLRLLASSTQNLSVNLELSATASPPAW